MKRIIPLLLVLVLLACSTCGAPSRRGSEPRPADLAGEGQVDPVLAGQLRSELARQLAERGITLDDAGQAAGKAISAVPVRTYFTPDRLDDVPSGGAYLGWLYAQKGDYDLNGKVNVADLTPVGIYFGIANTQLEWVQAQVADGDHNGVINIADVAPIGQNYGIHVYGFVIEVQDFAGEPWREFGFIPYSAGTNSGWLVGFGYTAQGGIDLPGFRAAPVGPPRDFDWDIYQLTDSAQSYETAVLDTLDGGARPVLACTARRDSYGSRLGFALANQPHPAAAADWSVEYGIALDYMGFDPPALAVVPGQNQPAIAYFADASPAADLRYLKRDMVGGGWSSHIVTTFMGYSGGLDLTTRLGQPVIYTDDLGLVAWFGTTDNPSSSFDWGALAAHPALASFTNISVVASGSWLFATGMSGAGGSDFAFSRSNAANPLSQSDFSEFNYGSNGFSLEFPSLALAGGIPAMAVSDSAAALVYHRAASRKDDSAIGWQAHVVAGGDGNLAETENPALCLVDGRPAVVAGFDPLQFYWAISDNPVQASGWRVQAISAALAHSTHSIISIGGLPLAAFETFDDALASSQITIATAREN